jgi:hypothetical protein
VSLSAATEFCVASEIVIITDGVLRAAGREGFEAFVVWGGTLDGSRFTVRSANVPEQRAIQTVGGGLRVVIAEAALLRLSAGLAERGEIPGAQVRSHPDLAFSAEADEELGEVTKRGAVSIVVPLLGRDGIRGTGTEVYRRSETGWSPIDRGVQSQLFAWVGDGRP